MEHSPELFQALEEEYNQQRLREGGREEIISNAADGIRPDIKVMIATFEVMLDYVLGKDTTSLLTKRFKMIEGAQQEGNQLNQVYDQLLEEAAKDYYDDTYFQTVFPEGTQKEHEAISKKASLSLEKFKQFVREELGTDFSDLSAKNKISTQ